MAGKAFLVRAGVFKDVDVTLFTHVGDRLGVSWGQASNNALISAIFKFRGSSAHAPRPAPSKMLLEKLALYSLFNRATWKPAPSQRRDSRPVRALRARRALCERCGARRRL